MGIFQSRKDKQDSSSAAPEAQPAGSALKEELRGKSYDEQVQMLAPKDDQKPAKPKKDGAEAFRLGESIRSLATRNAWAGVERAYEDALALDTEPSADTHYNAAQAARNLGNIRQYRQRLLRALNLGHKEAGEELEGLEGRFGSVTISRADGKRQKRNETGPELKPSEPFFDPERQRAVVEAARILKETGGFSGMLPGGQYKVGDADLTVVTRTSTQFQY